MLDTFRLEIAQVSLTLGIEGEEQGEKPLGYTGASQHIRANEFVQIRVKIVNLCRKLFHQALRTVY